MSRDRKSGRNKNCIGVGGKKNKARSKAGISDIGKAGARAGTTNWAGM